MRRLVAALLLLAVAQAAEPSLLGFSGPVVDGIPDGWKHVPFPSVPKRTSYAAVKSGDTLVLRAHANGSASVVVRRVTSTGDRLRWRWRAGKTGPPGGGSSEKLGDFGPRRWVGF